jgi:hypothetical protein
MWPACYSTATGSFIETGLPSEGKSWNLFIVNILVIRALTAGSFIKPASAQNQKMQAIYNHSARPGASEHCPYSFIDNRGNSPRPCP